MIVGLLKHSLVVRVLFVNLILFVFSISSYSQKHTYSGYAVDEQSGESLIGANVQLVSDLSIGTSTNAYGFFSISLDKGEYDIIFSYLGYKDKVKHIILDKDVSDNIELTPGITLDEIVVTGENQEIEKNVRSTQLGVNKLPVEMVKKLPAIMGEIDILKTLQLLPGVTSSMEGSSGFYVRGGGSDQNLVLLDEATVYSTGHLLGFFSIFNSDAINDTKLIKGTMPAKYGGRISSVLDIKMKEGSNKSYKISGGIGVISSKLTVEGPIVKSKTSFIVSGRRTYLLDLIKPYIDKTNFKGTNYFFYDLNTKINHKISNNDRLFLSGYFGRDVFKFNRPKNGLGFNMPYGNITTTARWNHLFSNKLFMNLSLIYNDYQFQFNANRGKNAFKLNSGIQAYQSKLSFEYYHNTFHKIAFGLQLAYNKLSPSVFEGTNGEDEFVSKLQSKYAGSGSLYLSDEIKLSDRLTIDLGLRYTQYYQLGPYTSIGTKNIKYANWEPVVSYDRFSPRASFVYLLSEELSLKGGISFTDQYQHLVSNSTSTLPTDVWVPSTENVKPQYGIQYSVGIFKNFSKNTYETSIEGYYKTLSNQIDYADDYYARIGEDIEKAFVYGIGRAYGLELLIKKNKGKFNGWLAYTFSKAERSFEKIENARWYPMPYDKTHDISLAANYNLSKKWSFSTVFVFGTGRPYTPILGFYFVDKNINSYHGPRNSERLSPYHRMDISATYTPSGNKKKKFKGSWIFSIYNVYNRKNPFFIEYQFNSDFNTGKSSIKASKITIFPIIPSISYVFKWQQ